MSIKKALDCIAADAIIGSTIAYLIKYLQAEPHLQVQIIDSPNTTKMLCIKSGLNVLPASSIVQFLLPLAAAMKEMNSCVR